MKDEELSDVDPAIAAKPDLPKYVVPDLSSDEAEDAQEKISANSGKTRSCANYFQTSTFNDSSAQ